MIFLLDEMPKRMFITPGEMKINANVYEPLKPKKGYKNEMQQRGN